MSTPFSQPCPHCRVRYWKLAKTRGEITITEIENSTGANRNTIKVHLKKLAVQHYLVQLGKGRGVRYAVK